MQNLKVAFFHKHFLYKKYHFFFKSDDIKSVLIFLTLLSKHFTWLRILILKDHIYIIFLARHSVIYQGGGWCLISIRSIIFTSNCDSFQSSVVGRILTNFLCERYLMITTFWANEYFDEEKMNIPEKTEGLR